MVTWILVLVALLLIGAGVGFYFYRRGDADEEEEEEEVGLAPEDSTPAAPITVKVGERVRLHKKRAKGHVYMTRPEDPEHLKLFKRGARVRFFNIVSVEDGADFPEVTKTLTSKVRWDKAAGSVYNSLKWNATAEPAELPGDVFADVEVTV